MFLNKSCMMIGSSRNTIEDVVQFLGAEKTFANLIKLLFFKPACLLSGIGIPIWFILETRC